MMMNLWSRWRVVVTCITSFAGFMLLAADPGPAPEQPAPKPAAEAAPAAQPPAAPAPPEAAPPKPATPPAVPPPAAPAAAPAKPGAPAPAPDDEEPEEPEPAGPVIPEPPPLALEPPAPAVTVAYQLPLEGPLPRTWRVTLAVTPEKEPDWIISTFVAGAARTVTEENQGRFTENWNGLDDNLMPVPPGNYLVKGIYLPAAKWEMDGQYHTLIARYQFAAGDSWAPPREEERKFPWIFGHVFGQITDIAVGGGGRAAFLHRYCENSWNPFLVDLNQPIGYDQVLTKYESGGIAGGETVACDGEYTWLAQGGEDAQHPAWVYRVDRRWGKGVNASGVTGRRLTMGTPSMVARRAPRGDGRLLYIAQPNPVNQVLILDGNTGADVATVAVADPRAIVINGGRLIALHCPAAGEWQVSAVPLANLLRGPREPLFKLANGVTPADLEADGAGNLYVSDPASSQVIKFDATGKELLRFGKAGGQPPGAFDQQAFMAPGKLATWTDADGKDRLLVIETAGPGRISEWFSDGTFSREWFLAQTSAQGYCLDPDQAKYLYNVTASGHLVRFEVDWEQASWRVNAVWPLAIGGRQYLRIVTLNQRRYLMFPGGNDSGYRLAIYRLDGDRVIAAAGLIPDPKEPEKTRLTNGLWWHDANGDGQVQEAEYTGRAQLPALNWWGDYWFDDLSLGVYAGQGKFRRLAPASFDEHGNPVYDGSKWADLVADPLFRLSEQPPRGDALHGGNELGVFSDLHWTHLAGAPGGPLYVADSFGRNNPGGVDTAGSHFAQMKLSRYEPDGQGGWRQQWRVGRKALRLMEPGEVYSSHLLTGPTYGLLGVFDSNGIYHVFNEQGLYIDTLGLDAFRTGLPQSGQYAGGGEAWYGRHFVDAASGKVYLLMGRAQHTVYEVEGWRADVAKPLVLAEPKVTLTAGLIAPANPIALDLRGGAGRAPVARFLPSTGGPPALDGALTGWESTEPVVFGLGADRQAEVRCMYDPQCLYLRWHVRRPEAFKPVDLGDATRLFTHDRGADTASFYLQADPSAAPGNEEGRPGDVRVVFSIVRDGEKLRPVALGLYPQWAGTAANPVTYTSPVGKTAFAHVGLIETARLGQRVDDDGKGWVIAAALPSAVLPPNVTLNARLRTQVDFAVTLGGITAFWWANVKGLNTTLTTDEPSEARLYPGAWAQAQFIGVKSLPIRQWLVCGPWGADSMVTRPKDPPPNTRGHIFTLQLFRSASYPPEGGNVDLDATFRGPRTRDVTGEEHDLRWHPEFTTGNAVCPCRDNPALAYAASWVWVPMDVKFDCTFHFAPSGPSQQLATFWVNGDRPRERDVSTWAGVVVQQPVAQQRLVFRKGWNKVFCRSYTFSGALTLGLTLRGAEDVLWQVKTSTSPYPVPTPEFVYDAKAEKSPEELKPFMAHIAGWVQRRYSAEGKLLSRLSARKADGRCVLYIQVTEAFLAKGDAFRKEFAQTVLDTWAGQCLQADQVYSRRFAHVVLVDQAEKIVGGYRTEKGSMEWLGPAAAPAPGRPAVLAPAP